MAVDVDLDGQGKPGGQADVQQTEFRIEEVEIEHQAAAEVFLEMGSSFAVEDSKSGAGFHGREDDDQSFGKALLLGNLTGVLFLTNLALQKAKGATGLFGKLLGVLLEPKCLLRTKLLEVLKENAAIGQETLHAQGIGERQIPLENQAIGAEQGTGDFVSMLVYKGVHGGLLIF